MRDALLAVIVSTIAGAVVWGIAGAVIYATRAQQSTADRRQAIVECKAAGGLPVVLAGQISSEGIGCAQPLGQ